MKKLDNLAIFQTLMSDNKFIHLSDEETIVGNAMIKEEWRTSTPEEKQTERRFFLETGKKRKCVINLEYYEKMIIVYDMIIEMLTKLETLIMDEDFLEKSRNLPLLRISALILVEQGFIDEYIVPSHHIRPIVFQNISDELNNVYPELNLDEFAQKYTDMFETWPEKTKYEIKKS